MFGIQDHADDQAASPFIGATGAGMDNSATDLSNGAPPEMPQTMPPGPPAPSAFPPPAGQPMPSDVFANNHPSPFTNPAAMPPPDPIPDIPSQPSPPSHNPSPIAPASGGDLASIKQQAIKQLSPLVGKLDQTPEEKFHTTMMMLQATDDQSLVKEAYAAAQSITDEKVKARALLDVVNEINYFTQKAQQAE